MISIVAHNIPKDIYKNNLPTYVINNIFIVGIKMIKHKTDTMVSVLFTATDKFMDENILFQVFFIMDSDSENSKYFERDPMNIVNLFKDEECKENFDKIIQSAVPYPNGRKIMIISFNNFEKIKESTSYRTILYDLGMDDTEKAITFYNIILSRTVYMKLLYYSRNSLSFPFSERSYGYIFLDYFSDRHRYEEVLNIKSCGSTILSVEGECVVVGTRYIVTCGKNVEYRFSFLAPINKDEVGELLNPIDKNTFILNSTYDPDNKELIMKYDCTINIQDVASDMIDDNIIYITLSDEEGNSCTLCTTVDMLSKTNILNYSNNLFKEN